MYRTIYSIFTRLLGPLVTPKSVNDGFPSPSTAPCSLPDDVLNLISEYSCQDTLLSLRAVSKQLCVLVTPKAFRGLCCTNTISSTDATLRLVHRLHIRRVVKELTFQDRLASAIEGKGCISEQDLEDVDDGELGERLSQSLRLLLQSTLHTLSMKFCPSIHHTMASGFEDSVQFTVLSTLADAQANGQSSLRTLTLENLFPYQAAVYSHRGLVALFRGLTCLKFTTADPAGDLFDSEGRDPVRPFWTETIRPLLFAAQDTLTSLTLHACNGRNSIPGAALQGLHFPSLTYLSLRHVTFRGRADVGAEVFILANSANLSSLILLNCRMDIHQYLTEWGIENDSHTWAEVYRSFNRDLVELRYIIIQEEVPPLPWDDVDLRYRFLLVDHDGMAQERHARFQDGDDEDARALKDLLEVVRLRRTARLSLLSKQS